MICLYRKTRVFDPLGDETPYAHVSLTRMRCVGFDLFVCVQEIWLTPRPLLCLAPLILVCLLSSSRTSTQLHMQSEDDHIVQRTLEITD